MADKVCSFRKTMYIMLKVKHLKVEIRLLKKKCFYLDHSVLKADGQCFGFFCDTEL